ncbi:MAG: Rrf2 family transcriptional regulator [Patescibacteria group bacterium]
MAYLNKEIDYALQLMSALRGHDEGVPLSLKAFAKDAGISFLFLQRIASKLKEAGLVRARLGASGGYFLSYSPEGVSLANVIAAIDGSFGVVPCVAGFCPQAKMCGHKNSFLSLDQELKVFFASKKLSQL